MEHGGALFSQLKDGHRDLSRNHRLLARYVVDHYQAVAFSTIKELSQQSGVSEATIVRFAKAMKFRGYPELQREVRRMVRADLRGTDRFKLTYTGVMPHKKGPLSAIIAREMDNLASLQQTFDAKAFRQAVATLRSASEIVVAGMRSTASLAQHLWFGLDKIELRVTRVTAITTETYDHIARLGAKACVVVIGFPRYLRELVELLDYAKRRGLKTVAITDSAFSALRADIMLCAPAESASFVAAHGAVLILINALLQDISALDKTHTLRALNRFEAVADDRSYFHTA